MTNVKTIPHYQNNLHWAKENIKKGKHAAVSEALSVGLTFTKSFTNEESFTNKAIDFAQKICDITRDYNQYSLYVREDDDVGRDLIEKPLAGKTGVAACFIEKYINPIFIPLSYLFGKNFQDAYCSISHYFNSLYWRARLIYEKIEIQSLKRLPIQFKKLLDKDISKKEEGCKNIKNALMPIFGFIGLISIGIFTPIKSFLKFKDEDNRIINALASIGFMTQNIYYFFRFTLPEHFNAKSKKIKDSKVLPSLGFASNIMNVLSPVFELIPHDKLRNLLTETAQGLNRLFFSVRRNILGNRWLAVNVVV